MRTERHRLTIFILLFAAFFAALVLFFAPVRPAEAATDPDETLGSGGETGGSSGETGGEEPAPAQNVATVTSGGSTTGYADFSSALAAWTEGATLTLLKDVTASTVTVSVSCTLDLNGFTLDGRSGRTLRVTGGPLVVTDGSASGGGELTGGGVRVERGGSLRLENGYITHNTSEDGAGVLVSDGGSLVMTGGGIIDNLSGGNGGGVCLYPGSSFRMTGGRIADNACSGNGGGVYAGGEVTLSGGASVSGNEGADGTENLYLAPGASIRADGLTGRVGVSMSQSGPFATGSASGFFSDSSAFEVVVSGSEYSLSLTPLASVKAVYSAVGNIYPTTELGELREGLVVTGVNQNGTEYPASRISFELSLPEGEERLAVGRAEVLVLAKGEGGETASASFYVDVIAPSLTSVEAVFEQTATVYFDSSLDVLVPDLTVTGLFNDGVSRPLGRTAAETQTLSGEDYITAFYTLSGDLASHVDGTAQVTVAAGGSSANIVVNISRHVVDTADIPVTDAVAVESEGAWGVSPEAFTPSLPAGVLSEAALSDGGTVGNLSAGIYTVQITFYVTDEKNYELIGGPRTATLTVYYASLTATNEDGTIFYTVEREGGIPLSWELVIEDVTEETTVPKLGGSMESRQIFSVSLRDGGRIVTELDTPLTVRIRIDGFFSNKNVTLFRLAEDGGHIAVQSTREGDYLVFSITSVQTQYAVAYDAGFGVYLALTIVFGVLCVGGAVLLFWYFKHKKKLDMTLPKNEQ